MLLMLRMVQIRWTRTWAEKGGRARNAPIVEVMASKARPPNAAGLPLR